MQKQRLKLKQASAVLHYSGIHPLLLLRQSWVESGKELGPCYAGTSTNDLCGDSAAWIGFTTTYKTGGLPSAA